MRHRNRNLRLLVASVALVASAASGSVQAVAPLLRPDIDLIGGALSEYAVGPWGWLNSLGFVGLGVAAAASGAALLMQGIPSRWAPIGATSLLFAAFFCVATAWYPMGSPGPVSPLGDAHQSAATLAAGFYLAAMAAFALAFRVDPRWRALGSLSALLAAIGIASALITQAGIIRPELDVPFGISMRGVSVTLGVWSAIVAARLWQVEYEAMARSSAAKR